MLLCTATFTLFCISILLGTVAGQDAIPALSVPASQIWDGIDGPWSTFWVSVGTPAQQVRVLPSTSGDHNALWVVLTEGCTPQDPSNCAQTRTVFNPNISSSWHSIGLFSLGLLEESDLGYDASADNAEFANETFTLGNNNGLPTINDSVVQGFATKDFYMGALGLAARAINISSFSAPKPSILQALRDQGSIPSLSWGYTAGSQNVDPPTFGSLTLGGYDSSRLSPNNVTVSFGADQSRDLLIAVQSITSGNTQLQSSGIFAFIDSLVAELWLPLATCEAFERAFGLTWNDTAQLYLVNDSLHDSLQAQNPSVTFQLGPTTSSSFGSVQVVLPYSAFDLSISPPYVSSTSRYFPLKRAQNSTQYTLGRTFLQYAYVVADYDRSQFQVYQAEFPPTSIPQNITAIYPPGQGSSGTGTSSSKSGIGTGAIAGIAVAVAVLLLGAALLTFFLLRRRRRTQKAKTAAELHGDSALPPQFDEQPFAKPELDATTAAALPRQELETNTKAELDGSRPKGTKPDLTGHPAYEMDSLDSHSQRSYARTELPGSPPGPGSIIHELPAGDVILPELPSSSSASAALSSHPSNASSSNRGSFSRRAPPLARSARAPPRTASITTRSSAALPSPLQHASAASRSSFASSSAAGSGVGPASRSDGTRHDQSVISPLSAARQSESEPGSGSGSGGSRVAPSPWARSPPPGAGQGQSARRAAYMPGRGAR
ncbi:MAG: hypothetical protein M1821_008950 [Bathelium mastoideum]|nr:MAG: hypothetical protein M1821_008950 [Bathelium mastoideum]